MKAVRTFLVQKPRKYFIGYIGKQNGNMVFGDTEFSAMKLTYDNIEIARQQIKEGLNLDENPNIISIIKLDENKRRLII